MNIERIDTRTGTNNSYKFSHGNTLPYTGVPFGMNYFSVQTVNDNNSWYFSPTSHNFCGIRLTHQPSPWIGDFQHISILALSKITNEDSFTNLSGSYNPDDAIFEPNYLKIHDSKYSIDTELVPTSYGAVISYKFKEKNSQILFQAPGKISFETNSSLTELHLSIQNGRTDDLPDFFEYMALHFSSHINRVITRTTKISETEYTQIIVDFGAISTLNLHIATSFISKQQAKINLNRIYNCSFNQVKKESSQLWQRYFDLIQIEDENEDKIKMFYQCLYRVLLFPQRAYELDKNSNPVHYDFYSKKTKSGYLYMNNGFWDTSRTVYPLFSILIPEELKKMLQGFYNSYLESGFLPKWLAPNERGMMPGTLIDSIIADSASKRLLTPNQVEEFLEAMISTSNKKDRDNKHGRTGIDDYNHFGYLPYTDYSESVNNSLDYCFSDFCISRMAEIAQKFEIADKYHTKSLNYQKLFDSNSGLMRAKDRNNQFRSNFSSIRWGTDYTEGSAWQNSFSVFHDINGLQKLYNGKKKFSQTLIDLCNQSPDYQVGGYMTEIHEMAEMKALNFGQLAISNQPSFHIPYLFMYTEIPEYTSLLIKQLINKFNTTIDGYPGDEDNGSMSAWFIFSTLGFYPVCPGTNQYVWGISIFDNIKVKIGDNFTTISTINNVDHNNFVNKIELNGVEIHKRFITHEELLEGTNIVQTLSVLPRNNRNRDQLPFSLTN